MVSRIDRLTHFLEVKTERTDENYLKVTAPVAKVGVYTYHNADGTTTKEFVSAATLRDQASIKTFEMKPVTNDHPDGMVNMDNAKSLKVGMTGETFSFDGKSLIATFVVTDSDAIRDVEAGKMQLSPGYSVDIQKESGEFEGEKYDAVQSNRRYNHLALVDRARGGDTLKIKLDRFDGIQIDVIDDTKQKEGDYDMPKENHIMYRLDGADYEIPVQVSTALESALQRVDALDKKVTTLTGEKETVEAKLDAANQEIETLKKVDHEAEIKKRVDARTKLVSTAKSVLGDEFKEDSSDEEIKLAITKKAFPKVKFDEEDTNYLICLDARFDVAVETLTDAEKKDNTGKQKRELNSGKRADGDTLTLDQVKQAHIDKENGVA